MAYLTGSEAASASAGERFRALLGRAEILQMPGAHNGLAALQARTAGFEALYLSGAGMSAPGPLDSALSHRGRLFSFGRSAAPPASCPSMAIPIR
jgi:2-methylisocitrate lyase-like PEP mutase family enzyme